MKNETKKKIIFISITAIMIILVFIILVQNTQIQKSRSNEEVLNNNILNHINICEEKINNDFQLIEPEYQFENSNEVKDSYFWKVTYQEDEQVKVTEFECKIWNNWKDARINRDISNNPWGEDIIYDDRN